MNRHPLADLPRDASWHLVEHFASDVDVGLPLFLERSAPDASDIDLTRRIVEAFRRADAHEASILRPEERPTEGMWENVRHSHHAAFMRMVANDDIEGISACLCNALREQISFGVGSGPITYHYLHVPGPQRDFVLTILRDRLVSVAEAMGLLPCETPEQGPYGVNMALEFKALVDRIEDALGQRIGRPAVMGLSGVWDDDQIIDFRVPDDAYFRWRMSGLLETHRRSRVCEIGCGFGGAASQFGKMISGRYTLIDLPVMNVIQAWFLAKVHGHGAVRMYGEPDDGQTFAVMPYWEFSNPEHEFDFVFNRDSMPEMPRSAALGYLDEIAHRRCGLLSINQEAQAHSGRGAITQLCVSQMVAAHGKLRRVSRHRDWLRVGYVEELYFPA